MSFATTPRALGSGISNLRGSEGWLLAGSVPVTRDPVNRATPSPRSSLASPGPTRAQPVFDTPAAARHRAAAQWRPGRDPQRRVAGRPPGRCGACRPGRLPPLRLLDALGLPLAAQVRLELGEDAQHVEEGLAGRRARVDWLLGRLQRDALLLQLMHDVLEITHGASQPVDAGDDDGVALVTDLEQEVELLAPIPLRAGDLLREDEIAVDPGAR